MKLVVSLLLLWVTAADPRLIKGNGNPKLSSQLKQNFDRLSQNVDVGTRVENCVQDYSPCRCVSYPNIYVTCTDIPAETVRNVFRRVNDSEIDYLELYLLPSNGTNIVSLPADLLGGTRVTDVMHIFGNELTYTNLVIDPLAFRSSQNSLTAFEFKYWDFGLQRDFNFFTGFDKLVWLNMYDLFNMNAFQHLPPLPSLRYLYIARCTGLINFPDLSPAKLENVEVNSCSLNDEMADEIVASLVANSTDSLLRLSLSDNSLTRIPNLLTSPFAFRKLKYLYLEHNAIETIEDGTFQGYFTLSSLRSVDLSYNKLVVFEENVFKELLKKIPTSDGSLQVLYNPFACGCDIAWLIRNNRNLLPVVIGGFCGSDSPFQYARFQDLDPESFARCPNSASSNCVGGIIPVIIIIAVSQILLNFYRY